MTPDRRSDPAAGAPLAAEDPPALARRTRILRVAERLRVRYGGPEPRPIQDPLSELVQTVLSQNTADVNSDRAFANLMARYGGDWQAVRVAPTDEVAEVIRVGGLAGIKAARIKAILDTITERRGDLDLSFLRHLPLEDARAFLRSLPGVGPKTAACVLLFACGQPAMPVDTHVHRVSTRLGLVPARVSAEQAHDRLESATPPEWVYPVHMLLIRHGRETCKAQRPRCQECPVFDLCAYPGRTAPSDVG